MKTIEVVAAIIKNNSKILCAQRGSAKYDYISHKWEFPGGKVEDGETLKDAIEREIKEELKLNIKAGELLLTVEHNYPDFKIIMHAFVCESSTDEITLTEHVATKWLETSELYNLDWAAADIPIVEKLMD
jgi:8-oxo-dGTP diphosphatase